MLKVYGVPVSRAGRVHWLCRELGIEFEQVPVSFFDGSTSSPEFLAINPTGKIPAIDDEGLRLAESMAINLYLAKKHRSALLPASLEGEARVLQWSFWAVAEVEKPLLQVLMQRLEPGTTVEQFFRPRIPLDPALEQAGIEALQRPLALLEAHLADREYLLGAEFTLADLNVAAVMSWVKGAKLDLSAYPRARAWLGRCLSRPAASRPKKS